MLHYFIYLFYHCKLRYREDPRCSVFVPFHLNSLWINYSKHGCWVKGYAYFLKLLWFCLFFNELTNHPLRCFCTHMINVALLSTWKPLKVILFQSFLEQRIIPEWREGVGRGEISECAGIFHWDKTAKLIYQATVSSKYPSSYPQYRSLWQRTFRGHITQESLSKQINGSCAR